MAETEDFRPGRGAETGARPGSVGLRLRSAREVAGLSLADISARTRIPQRHLSALEDGRFADLASATYAIGFARAYARSVGLDEARIAAEVRAEIASEEPDRPRPPTFEPGDPARVPGPRLAWLAALAAIVLAVAVFVFWRSYLSPSASLAELSPEQSATPGGTTPAAAPSGAPRTAAAAAGPVVFTALEPGIWVKFYDASGQQLMQKQMARGETYAVPPEAQGPQVWTGRPDALAITVGGRPVPPLADRQTIVKNVPVSAAALLARGSRPPSPTPAAGPRP